LTIFKRVVYYKSYPTTKKPRQADLVGMQEKGTKR